MTENFIHVKVLLTRTRKIRLLSFIKIDVNIFDFYLNLIRNLDLNYVTRQ